MDEKNHDSKGKLAAITEIVKGVPQNEICEKWQISQETLNKWIEEFCSRAQRLSELKEAPPQTPEREEVKRSDVLAVYGSYTNMMEALQHYDQLSYASETEVSSANWYSVTAVLVIFSLSSKEYHLSLLLAVIVGLVDLSYLTSRFVIAIIKNERAGAAFFFNALKLENKYEWLPQLFHSMFTKGIKKTEEGEEEINRVSYHGSPYMKAYFYIANISVPFILIFPSLYQLEYYDHFAILHKFIHIPLYVSYTILGVGCFSIYVTIILKFVRPFMSWLGVMEQNQTES